MLTGKKKKKKSLDMEMYEKRKSLQPLITYHLPHGHPSPRNNYSEFTLWGIPFCYPLRAHLQRSTRTSFELMCRLRAGLRRESHAARHRLCLSLGRTENTNTWRSESWICCLVPVLWNLGVPSKVKQKYLETFICRVAQYATPKCATVA